MKIRLATPKDAKDIAEIIKRNSQDDYMGYVTFGESYVKDKMKKDFFLIAEDTDASERIVGCLRASMVEIDLAEIRTLCVDELYRRKGIATELLTEAIDLLKKKNMRKLVARSKSDNKAALDLFKKFGFEQEGYFKEHYRKGIDVIQFGLFL